MTTADPLLSGSGLSKSYGGVHAVSDVSFTLHAGEVLGLIGPNGAGKTTLVDLVTGAQDADTGELVLTGSPLRGGAAHRAAQGLARTFQHPQLALDLSVADNLLLGAYAAGTAASAGCSRAWSAASSARTHPPTGTWPSVSPRRSGSPGSTGTRATSPSASNASSRSAGRSAPSPACCSSTSPSPAPTPTASPASPG
ncbi:ATP-binding cassette domain-containing protein [Pimelobacter simplex]|uniref:ATP-binding cassette domain-containing protein n=1 Tax=Nocardioides simplex TaxID=2045 RepID=UPI001C202AC3|nr:ATP-binding cassette domain-containing protein [Pimelobacter simplex]